MRIHGWPVIVIQYVNHGKVVHCICSSLNQILRFNGTFRTYLACYSGLEDTEDSDEILNSSSKTGTLCCKWT